jgi:TonB-dependent SusC/RagA subfamily outer membrane receptor
MVIDEIMLKNTTGTKGQFRIKVLSTASNIGVSVHSLSAIEQPINGRTEIRIVIKDSIHEIITAQVNSKIKPDKSDIITSYTNIYDMIRAKLPSVEVNGTSLKVRGGATSFLMDTEPLLIVDGIVVSSFSSISPQEVDTINLLKGPDASIYGSRGANGVILITLKKRKQQP